jgi:hypothetical protein
VSPSADDGELAGLRADVLALRGARDGQGHRIRWRSVAAVAAVVLGCLLAPVSVTAVWAHDRLADTDRFVATTAPLAADPAVRAALTDRVTDTVVTYVGAAALRGFVHDRVAGFVASAAFATLWAGLLRTAHQALSGDAPAVAVRDGQVVLGLGPVVAAVRQHLVAAGFGPARLIPDVDPAFALADAAGLDRARGGYRLLTSAAGWLPWVTVVLLAVGGWLARARRRALLGVGVGIAVGMVVLAVALVVARHAMVSGLPAQSVAVAGAAYDVLVTSLRDGVRALFTAGLAIALGAALARPSAVALARLRGRRPAAPDDAVSQ